MKGKALRGFRTKLLLKDQHLDRQDDETSWVGFEEQFILFEGLQIWTGFFGQRLDRGPKIKDYTVILRH
jgi:hypothetical protein